MQSVGGTPRAGDRGRHADLPYFRARFQRQFFKTKTCSFWKVGCCSQGESCKFAHGIKELNGKPSLDYTALCPQARRGQCSDPECRYAHDISDLRSTRTFRKTKMCAFHLSGHCSHGLYCRFAHAEGELRESGDKIDDEIHEPLTWDVNTDDEIDELMEPQQWGRNATVPTGFAPERMSSSPYEGIPAIPDSDAVIDDEECDGLGPLDWSRTVTVANPVDPQVMKGLHRFARGVATERISEEAEQDGFFATDHQWFRPGRSPGTAGPVDRAGALQAGSLGGPALGEHAPTEPTLPGAQALKPTELSAPQLWKRSTTGPAQLSHQQCGAWGRAPSESSSTSLPWERSTSNLSVSTSWQCGTSAFAADVPPLWKRHVSVPAQGLQLDEAEIALHRMYHSAPPPGQHNTAMPVQPQQHGDESSGVKQQPQRPRDPPDLLQRNPTMPVQSQQYGDESSGVKRQPQRLWDQPAVPWHRNTSMLAQPQQHGDESSGVKQQPQRPRDPPDLPWQRNATMPVQSQQYGDESSGVKRQPQRLWDQPAVPCKRPWHCNVTMPVQPQQQGDGYSGVERQQQRQRDPPVPWERSVTMPLQPQQQGDGHSAVKR